ncbi:hypothetical protein [Acidimangrovimonas sediminis]|uniref:hypothetical protein n=1 Tax=Acidimangrovimonas sediminis TaxID=2056283 RepID=UPI000C7FE72D|nr:hypothetical protein [Acidimangrovimonas sediminis]
MAGRIRTLELVADLRRRAMEAQAETLSRLRARIAELDARRAALLAALRGGSGASLEAAPYLPSYLRAMRAEEAALLEERARLVTALAEVEAALRQRFRETRASEQALGTARHAEVARLARAERKEMEEIALRPWTLPGHA